MSILRESPLSRSRTGREADRAIAISDNGRGMTDKDLQHFFTMHGENVDRLKGRPGRGKFGTGKSAAFGIAMTLRVDTVRDGLRNVRRAKEARRSEQARRLEMQAHKIAELLNNDPRLS
jgi:hypothetical protein